MKPKQPTDAEVTDEMAKIERDARQKRYDDDKLAELAFFRLLRDSFTEFLEAKPWVKSVGSNHWVTREDGERSGLCLDVRLNHDQVADLEMIITRGQN
jgi:hypothetical protein